MRTLGIDYGTRRVGIALSDEGGKFATPIEVLNVTAPQQATERILALVAKEAVERLVVGVPLNMDDTVGPAARGVVAWANELANRADIPLVLVDERLSSFEAEQQLSARKRGGERLTHKRKKEQLDALAAANLLQAFLDGKLPPIEIK